MIANLSKRPIDIKQAGILNAALTLFLHWDFSQVSVKQIISAAGISKGAFYRFYATKNALLLDLLMDEAFHIDQWVLCGEDDASNVELVKRYFLEIGRHLERYQLHQEIECYLERVDKELFAVFNEWKKRHRLWIKHQLLKRGGELDDTYAQCWAFLEGCLVLQKQAHFQRLCGRRHPFEMFIEKI